MKRLLFAPLLRGEASEASGGFRFFFRKKQTPRSPSAHDPLFRGSAIGLAVALLLIHPAKAADVMKGQRIYRMHCASCHGLSGVATMPNAPSFARGERLMQPDPALLGAIRAGRGPMPGYFGVLNDRDTLDVIAYLRTMR